MSTFRIIKPNWVQHKDDDPFHETGDIIVNVNHIVRIESTSNGGSIIVMDDGFTIGVGVPVVEAYQSLVYRQSWLAEYA